MFENNPGNQRPAHGIDGSDEVTADAMRGYETGAVLAIAWAEIGKPYAGPLVGQQDSARWGSLGWDCSSFVSAMYERAYGVKLTAFTDDAYRETVPVDDPRPGDIVFYCYDDPSQPGVTYPHMGLYVGPGRVLDSRSGDGVGLHEDVRGATAEYRRAQPRCGDRPSARAGNDAGGPEGATDRSTESPLADSP
jgi:cell wall-associated NlpC family hydrolase